MKRRSIIALALVILLAAVAFAGVILISPMLTAEQTEAEGEQVHRPEALTIDYGGQTYTYREDLETIVFIGLDGVTEDEELSYNNQVQSDYVTLILLDHESETVRILQLNRDSMCDIPILDTRGNRTGSEMAQLALAHTYGSGGRDSCRNVVDTVENFLYGIRIDHYFSISIDSVSVLNDLVGGVEVTLEDDFSSFDPAMQQGTTLTLEGEQAEIFVRARKGVADETNISRMERQKTYLKAWIPTARDALTQDEDLIVDGLLEISSDLVSDMSVYDLADLFEQGTGYEVEAIFTPEGESRLVDGHMAFYVDEEKLKELVVESFFEQK